LITAKGHYKAVINVTLSQYYGTVLQITRHCKLSATAELTLQL